MLILSLDGGGVRGMLSAALVLRVEQEFPGWLGKVDLFAGSSTGGILALGYAHGMSAFDAVEFYRERMSDIFYQSWWRRFTMLWRAKYSNSELMDALDDIFGDDTLRSLQKDVLIATYYLGREAPFEPSRARFYDRSDADLKIADLALWTSSAPTYFPSAGRHVDGGVAANNCAVCAMAYAKSKGTPLSEIKVISVGTGRISSVMEGGDQGLAYWGKQLLVPFVDGNVDVADYQAHQFLKDSGNYHRLQPELPFEVDLDDASRLDDLIDLANQEDIGPTVEWLTSQLGPITS